MSPVIAPDIVQTADFTVLRRFHYDPAVPMSSPVGGLNNSLVFGGLCHVSKFPVPVVWLHSVNFGRIARALPAHACDITIRADLKTREVAFQYS